MKNNNPIKLARICYWIGAILDAKVAFLMIFPNVLPALYLSVYQDRSLENSQAFITMRLLSSLIIFAWTCLLLWADRKPLERKDILLLTAFILTGIVILRISQGLFKTPLSAIFTILVVLLDAFYTSAYFLCKKYVKSFNSN